MEGNFLKLIKDICEKPIPNYILDERPKAFPLRSNIRQGYRLLPLLFNVVHQVLANAFRQEEGGKWLPNWKRRSKTIFTDDIILHAENLKEAIHKKIIRDNK